MAKSVRKTIIMICGKAAPGGGDFRMFRGKPIVKEVTVDMAEIIAEYLMKAGVIDARVNDNWKVHN